MTHIYGILRADSETGERNMKRPVLMRDAYKNISRLLSALYAIARPSVRPSDRHTDGSVKMVEVRIMKYSPYGSPITLVLAS